VIEILGQLTAAAGRRTEVIVTTYYNPLGSCFLSQINPVAVAVGVSVRRRPGLLAPESGRAYHHRRCRLRRLGTVNLAD
jgi:hypothetical protein